MVAKLLCNICRPVCDIKDAETCISAGSYVLLVFSLFFKCEQTDPNLMVGILLEPLDNAAIKTHCVSTSQIGWKNYPIVKIPNVCVTSKGLVRQRRPICIIIKMYSSYQKYEYAL